MIKLLTVFCAAVLSAAACVHSPPTPPDAPDLFRDIVAGAAPWDASGGDLAAAAVTMEGDAAPVVWAKAVVERAPGLAKVRGGLPLVARIKGLPVAGRPWTVAWTTRTSAPLPRVPVALLVSSRRVAPALLPNTNGAWLQVLPSFVVTPQSGGALTQDGGTIRLDMTWPAGAVGTEWFMQLLVQDRRVPGGVTVTPAVAITVGNR